MNNGAPFHAFINKIDRIRKNQLLFIFCAFCMVKIPSAGFSQKAIVQHDAPRKKVSFGNDKIKITLDYNRKACISLLTLNGQSVIEGNEGVYSKIRIKDAAYSSLQTLSEPLVKVDKSVVSVEPIDYGDSKITIHERWTFSVSDTAINFQIDRTISQPVTAETTASPVFTFANINTWDGAYQEYGGLAWFYLFNKKLDAYGVHSNTALFWNEKTGNGLSVSVASNGGETAMTYTRTARDELAYSIMVSPKSAVPRFDADTQRRLFLRGTTEVWAPVKMGTEKTSQRITLSYFDFAKKFDRGKFIGVSKKQVSAVLNTIARIGVIDKNHFGANSWHTPYGPICLHEQYIAQIGLAINDPAYLKGYRQCLDFYRDHAVKPDGRVWPRWAYSNEDMMPGEVNDKGFYEAQWGYLLDSNPDLVTNISELYAMTGDLEWVRTHQQSCEKILDWILKRDSNNNGLVEMITDSHKQKRGSDWIDIIWAAYENAFVNAKLYHALTLWATIEKELGNVEMESHYKGIAEKLKNSFNQPIAAGGFWNEGAKCYVHWRDKDGSIHGSNMVTPVNFMAIAYGICDDPARSKTILDDIENQMQKEQLFFWPICMRTYEPGDGNDWQFPFPNYENGDLFLSWGAVGVKAYADYKPELALKYVRNVLAQYDKDGLAFQRYGRLKQDGLGDDILSGNCLSVVGLYHSIYGINPRSNRLYLNPHLTNDLSGTELNYNFRNQKLKIGLSMGSYSIANDHFKIKSKTDFGFYGADRKLQYFDKNAEQASMTVTAVNEGNLFLDIIEWGQNMDFSAQEDKIGQQVAFQIQFLKKDAHYAIEIDGKKYARVKSNSEGGLRFDYKFKNKSPKRISIAVL